MREIVAIRTTEILPDPSAVLDFLDVPASARDNGNGRRAVLLAGEAIAILQADMKPVGLYEDLPLRAFQEVHRGEGRNISPCPLEAVAPRAERLALHAATIGAAAGARIKALFDGRDFALAAMVDAAASLAAGNASDAVLARFMQRQGSPGSAALPYSPGYCGWDVTGQRKLFAALRPGEIGITLNESCLMQPLKSVSGVIVAGAPGIHEFDDTYPFCAVCVTRECRDRIRRVAGGR